MAKHASMPEQPSGDSDRRLSDAAPEGHAPRSLSSRRPFVGWLLLATLIIVLDQVAKIWFDANLLYGERWKLLPFFDFTLVYNAGAAFSFLADAAGWQRWFFTAIAIVAAVIITRMLWKHSRHPVLCSALACILGGALGNAIDRLIYGHVVDFLLFYWQDWYFPAFNIADVAITIGAILLLLDEILRWRHQRQQRAQQ